MSRTLTLEIPDEIYQVLEQLAAQTGKPLATIALEWVAARAPRPQPPLSSEERQAARARLLRHAGAVESGDPHSADNERIDADLARAYENTHEEEH